MRFILILMVCLIPLFSKEYFVDKIYDGDTIGVNNGNENFKVRFYGIDAPEREQDFGIYCAEVLSQKLLRQNITLDIKDVDKYGRKVAIVYLNNSDINRYMVQQGCAWAYTYYTDIYKQDELKARKNLDGLWIDKNAMEPYKFRKMNKYKRSESDEIKKMLKIMLFADR